MPESTKIPESNQNTGKHMEIPKSTCNRGGGGWGGEGILS